MALANVFSSIVGKEEIDLIPVPQETPLVEVVPPRDHAELLENYYDMKDDVEVIETVITQSTDPEFSGNEHFQDNSSTLVGMTDLIKEKYGREVPATINGLEGFFGDLKKAFGEVLDELSGKPTKAEKAKIKKYFFEARKAVEEYSSKSWLESQKWINVGKVKIQVPAVFAEINTGEGMSTIVGQFSKACEKQVQDNLANSEARLTSGLKIFNQLKNKEPVHGEELSALITGKIKPDALPDIKGDAITSLIDVSLVKGELPVLKKDDIAGVVKVLKDALASMDKMYTGVEKLLDRSLSVDDFFESDFFDATFKEAPVKELYDAVTFDDNSWNAEYILEGYTKQMLVVAKFIESWILNSVK